MYAKLFSSILDSSLWTADHPTRILFLTMLAMADREGRIFASRSGLARRAVLTDDELELALSQLSQPDHESSDLSRNPENEGRRVQPADGGWQIINYAYYRDLQDEEERRHHDRMRQRKHREKSRLVTKRRRESQPVALRHASESESESDVKDPQPPQGGGDALRANPRSLGTNPRALGTNPRAVGERASRVELAAGRPDNPGTIKSDADLSYFEQPLEPMSEEEIKSIHEHLENLGGNPVKAMESGMPEQRRERLKAQARRLDAAKP